MSITLKGDHETFDRRLDRLPEFDEKSREFPIRTLLAQADKRILRSYSWFCPQWLDQGREGACVGFSWAHELAAYPARVSVDADFARNQIYKPAQFLDEWPGEQYEGTSVLAGAKQVHALGYMDEYRWAFGIDDALMSISHNGPVIIGINWYESMMQPRPSGLLEVSEGNSGGHAICVRGVLLKPRLKGEGKDLGPIVRLRNSWGPGWGEKGDCFMKVEDFEKLLNERGECCVPVLRNKAPKPDYEAMEELEDF